MKRLAPSLLLLGLILGACSKSREAAQAATDEFRARFDAGKYTEIYRQAGPEFQAAATEPDFARMMDGIAKKLGRHRSSSQRSWNVHFGTGGRTITLGYASEFEHGAATETFVWRSKDGAMLLEGYNVNSPALLTQ